MATIKTIYCNKIDEIYFGKNSLFHLLREDETIYLRQEKMAVANYINSLIKRINEATQTAKEKI